MFINFLEVIQTYLIKSVHHQNFLIWKKTTDRTTKIG